VSVSQVDVEKVKGGNLMETRTVSDAVAFSEVKMKKNALFDSPHLYYDAYCLLPGQSQKVHAHEGSDKVYYVLRGTGRFTVGEEERDLGEGNAVIARAGDSHGVRNETQENLVILVTMAPRSS
jgi:mannose-6-phosphate isomerase-like protein (cupin superfamily)